MQWTTVAPVVLASFMASMVEFVEALTIVLAVGLVRGWRSALLGVAASLATLVVLVLAFGPWLARIPLHLVQLFVGTLLLLFGLRWLRKAVLRAAGVLAKHDEATAFAEETEALRRRGDAGDVTIDKIAFATSYKIVMLEGMEVVFIVIALGAGGSVLLPAAAGALLALAVVVLLGIWLHKPLANVPENALKFAVGVMLVAFGTFWVGEGVGIAWPRADGALLALIAAFLVLAAALVPLCRRLQRAPRRAEATPIAVAAPGKAVGALVGSWNELTGLFVDDGLLAAGVVVWVTCTWASNLMGVLAPAAVVGAIFATGLATLLTVSSLHRARH